MSRMSRSLSEQAAAIQHLFYEYSMTEKTARRLIASEAGDEPLDVVSTNAYIESFLVHVRALMHVVGWSRSKSHGEDVLAKDLLPAWRPSTMPPILDVKEAINGRVAHLSYVRLNVTVRQKDWVFAPIANAILDEVERFIVELHRAAPSVVGSEWGVVVAAAIPASGPTSPRGPRFPVAELIAKGATGMEGMAATGSTSTSYFVSVKMPRV